MTQISDQTLRRPTALGNADQDNSQEAEKLQPQLFSYWADCYEKDNVDEDGVPFADNFIFVSYSPLSEQAIELLLRSRNRSYKLLAWGEFGKHDEF